MRKDFLKRATRKKRRAIRGNRPYLLIDGADCADVFGKVFAVARGLIERFETRIGESFRKADPARKRAVDKDELVPLDRRDLIVETRD